jgi:EAL domain-containing protein (putative c-di-GMP-specific phosphodiesterase class I)
VVAEGVETAAQVELLRRLGCDLIQGHWVSRPMTANDFARYLRQKGASPRSHARTAATLARS